MYCLPDCHTQDYNIIFKRTLSNRNSSPKVSQIDLFAVCRHKDNISSITRKESLMHHFLLMIIQDNVKHLQMKFSSLKAKTRKKLTKETAELLKERKFF